MTDVTRPAQDTDAAPGRPIPEGWTVSTLQESDLDDVLAVEAASFSNPWTRDMFLRELANAGVSYGYVLRGPDGRAAAFCTIWVVVDEVHINNLAVDPAWRGRGLGQSLLEFILRLWSDSGCRAGHARGAAVERGRHQPVCQAGIYGGGHPSRVLHPTGRGRPDIVARTRRRAARPERR